jgi:hypothetical protein
MQSIFSHALPSSRWRRAAREPLLHFALLGAAIFAADQAVLAVRGDAGEIVISAATRKEARDTFVAGIKREPSPAELKVLLDRWRDNEVLYREGLALGLDKGDSAIRERVIFKALSVTQSGIAVPAIDEAGLRRWYEGRRGRYDVAARFDFQEAVVAGDAAPERLQAFAQALNGKGESQAESSLRIFKDRPRGNLVASYGEAFAKALEQQAPGEWAVLQAQDGPRVIRLELVKAARPSNFEDLKDRVYQDWRDEQGGRGTQQAIDAMASKYRVRMEGQGE